ncbi:MAG TPA: hypothetical protein VMZ73_06765 [Acidimicrobiales bacterium]|nr:hypothetical protein [Acidimicrobiales bacterium]
MAVINPERPAGAHALTDRVVELAREQGLDAVGVAPAEPFLCTRELLEERKQAGLHAGSTSPTVPRTARPTPIAACGGAVVLADDNALVDLAEATPAPSIAQVVTE